MALSNTGSMALRLDEVQPPNTAATQSLLISFSAFSAKTVGSDAPSSPTSWICLPSTPPSALICSTARSIAFRTVTSEIAMVPDSEFKAPTLMVSPEVSTHDSAFAESVSLALLPQPASSRLAAVTTHPAVSAERDKEWRRGCCMYGLSGISARVRVVCTAKFQHRPGVESGR